MKLYLAILLFLTAVLTSARAQEDADSRYVDIYGVIEQANTLLSNGQTNEALTTYQSAQTQLLRFQRIYPEWDSDIVNYRLEDLAGKIAALQAVVPAPTPAMVTNPPAATPPSSPAPVAVPTENPPATPPANNLQLDVLQSQLQSLKDDNAKLQAKLQEALASQPQMVSASALENADNQIRALMKENDLLKASLHAAAQPSSDAEISALRSQLADTTKKLADEHARAEKLAQENATLQTDLANAGKQSGDATSGLRDENDRLKSQLDSMQTAALQTEANNSAAASESAAQLNAAKEQVGTLKSAVMLATLEKLALEDRLKHLRSVLADTNASYQASIRDLTAQRDDLTQKLNAKSAEAAAAPVTNTPPVAVAEAPPVATPPAQNVVTEVTPTPGPAPQPVPTPVPAEAPVAATPAAPVAPAEPAAPVATPAQPPAPVVETTPVAQPAPVVTAPVAESAPKAVESWPAGTADLVASAQNHYANHEFDLAEADLRKILALDENNSKALADLALIEMNENKMAEAEKDIKTALAQFPDSPFDLAVLGKIKFQENDFDAALDALNKSASQDPNNPETENYIGVSYSHKGMYKEAETVFRKVIQIDPNYASAHENLAAIYVTQHPPLPQLARWHYQKAIDAGEPRNPDMEKLLNQEGAPVGGGQ